jgi:hypothetical protein
LPCAQLARSVYSKGASMKHATIIAAVGLALAAALPA